LTSVLDDAIVRMGTAYKTYVSVEETNLQNLR
jgi:hypothetical protein